MRDILPPDSARWRRFVGVFAGVVEAAGYGQIMPPLLEDLGVFTRIGEATDVVTKEMYDFVDKGGRHIALRPEVTASTMPRVGWGATTSVEWDSETRANPVSAHASTASVRSDGHCRAPALSAETATTGARPRVTRVATATPTSATA